MRKTILATTAALLCAFNGTANAQTTRYDLSTADGETIDVFEYSQEDAREIFANAPKLEQNLNSVIINMTRPAQGVLIQLSIRMPAHPAREALAKDIYDRAIELDIEHETAEKFALTGSTTLTDYIRYAPFKADVESPFNGLSPSALGWAPDTEDGHAWPATSAGHCLIINTGKDFSIDAWFEGHTHRTPKADHNIPDVYGDFFRKHTTYHEQAHCFGASESESDYIASMQLMLEHKDDPEMFALAKGFVNFMGTLRTYSFYAIGLRPQYKHTGEANILAHQHVEALGFENIETAEDIWSMARDKNFPFGTTLSSFERFILIASSVGLIEGMSTETAAENVSSENTNNTTVTEVAPYQAHGHTHGHNHGSRTFKR